MTTDVDVLNGCLMRIGAQPVESRDDPDAVAAWACYDAALLEILGGYPWTFARRTRQLVQVAVSAELQWPFAYQVPADLHGAPRALYASGSDTTPWSRWERAGDLVLTDLDQAWMRYTRRTAPDEWPPLVQACIRIAVMAELALSIREDRVMRDALRVELAGTPGEGQMGGKLGRAFAQDAMSEPPPTIGMGSNPLIDVRGSTGFTW